MAERFVRNEEVRGSIPLSSTLENLDSADRLPGLYLKTIISIEQAGRLVPARESALVAQGNVHVITAWNPGHLRPSEIDNRAADEQLRLVLNEMGLEPTRAIGADPDSPHFEESWAVAGLTDSEAKSIGARFGQVAVFKLSSKTQSVLACNGLWEKTRPL